MHCRRFAHVALAAVLSGLLAPAAADAALVVQRSIAGVKLGMTRAQVEAKLGEPSEVKRRSSEIFGGYTELRYGLTYISLFAGTGGEAFNLHTTSKRQRISHDVGVGSSEKILRRHVRGVSCETAYGRRTCTVGRLEPGRVVTTFRVNRRTRRVSSISIGRVID